MRLGATLTLIVGASAAPAPWIQSALAGFASPTLWSLERSLAAIADDWTHSRAVEGTSNIAHHEPLDQQHLGPPSPGHSRVKEPGLCDPDVKQYSGYLDLPHGKHLFFWFFEARHDPVNAPVILWLNGGPGCSSLTGMLFELGPCAILENGTGVAPNPYSWNNRANIIFLDQPVETGFSYSNDGSTVSTNEDAAFDVWAFLQGFFARFPAYAGLPFHIACESYGGHYCPHIASVIHHHNLSPPSASSVHINLESILIGNGITEPVTQFGTIPEFACDGPFPMFNDTNGPECTELREKAPRCQRLLQACYAAPSRFTCVPAQLYCFSQLQMVANNLGLNGYDVRRKCDPESEEDGPMCYKEFAWIDAYFNRPDVKHALGVAPARNFTGCSATVNRAFSSKGEGMRNSAALLPELLHAGVRLLVYAGNADFGCNFLGEAAWMAALRDHPFAEAFARAEPMPWVVRSTGRVAGAVRAAGARGGFTAGNFTYVAVYDAGHMVPHDVPEAALDLVERWMFNQPLTYATDMQANRQ